MANTCIAQTNDSIVYIHVASQIDMNEKGELKCMEFPFFDTDVKKIYYQFALSGKQDFKPGAFVFLEIKKHSNMQYKLKPLHSRLIKLSAIENNKYTDSILLGNVRLPSGNFDIILNLMQDSFKVLQIKKTKFQLLRDTNEKIIDEYYEEKLEVENKLVNIEKSFVAKYDVTTLQRNIAALRPIAKGIELKVIKDITNQNDLEFLRRFFYNFWYNRNASDPEAEWKIYTEKLNTVAKLYGNASLPGYESDRGRIYLAYGEPDVKEKVQNEKDALPYEVWNYKTIGKRNNINFLFVQNGMSSSLMYLLHSNLETELINPYWKQTLLLNPDEGDNKLKHRVFEYFNR